jgi:phosphopantothenoylcysteine decarboxylase/phosphopantothenate--cysteine ligase
MLEAAGEAARDADLFVAVAAVADYRPAEVAPRKLKKDAARAGLVLELVENPDVVATVARQRGGSGRPYTVAFAAETHDVLAHARGKLAGKGVDLVVANDVSDRSIGFGAEDNEVTLVDAEGDEALPRMPKDRLARVLVERLAARLAPAPAAGRPVAPQETG